MTVVASKADLEVVVTFGEEEYGEFQRRRCYEP